MASVPFAWLRRGLATALVIGCMGSVSTPVVAHAASAAATIDCETTEDDAALLICAKNDYESGQHHMDQLVAATTKSLSAVAQPVFAASQKAWVAYRDADCRWNAYDTNTGKVSDLILMNCLADLTISRAEELEAGTGAQ